MHGDNDDQLEMLIFEDGGPHESEFWKAKAAADGRIQYMHRGSPLNVDTCNANNPSQSSIGGAFAGAVVRAVHCRCLLAFFLGP